MNTITNIVFEKYGNGKVIISCTNTETKIKISKIPATILDYLIFNLNDVVDKETLLSLVWGKSDFFIQRSFDVHLSKVKKILKGTDYSVVVSRGQLGVFKIEENDN